MALTLTPHSTSESNSKLDPAPIPPSDLRFAIRDLISRAETAIKSVHNFLRGGREVRQPEKALCCCPFDSKHRMPPKSLFRHWLRCQSAPGGPITDLGFLETLQYPKSFKSGDGLSAENHFTRSLPQSGADLCFSLEKELEDTSESAFFYKNCPGVVTYTERDVPARTFSLPIFLAQECANFISPNPKILQKRSTNVLLPSEIWAFWKEIEAWEGYPPRYSSTAVQIAASLPETFDSSFENWILSNSPRFGLIIDTAMGDHIYLLLKLILLAFRREALNSFECPRFSEAMAWMGSLLGILYGEINGRNFAIAMVAEFLKRAGSNLLIFPSENQTTSAETLQANSETLYVSQIASAVAALHERAMLEERVKQMRFPRQIPKSQLLQELSIVSSRAREERSKRSNYRPLLEYDGIISRKSRDQDNARTKTAEELLAEERDYKRRRMSYRGKKIKRTTIEVTRDLIEDHMKEIMEAGGIGSHVGEHEVSDISNSTISEISANDRRTSVTSGMDAPPRERSFFTRETKYDGHARSWDHGKLSFHPRGQSYDSHSSRDFYKKSPSSSSSLSAERFRNTPERRKQSRQRSEDAGARVKFDDRYNPFDAYE